MPVVIHRALLGSLERFIGILIEHVAGAFPLWIAPVQVIVLPVADRHHEYAERVAAELVAAGLRAEPDLRGESVGKKIAEAEHQRMPCILVVGDREAEARDGLGQAPRQGRPGRAAAGRAPRRARGGSRLPNGRLAEPPGPQARAARHSKRARSPR